MPIKSDPSMIDGDADGMLDNVYNDLDKADYWDIEDANSLYAFTNTSNNYGVNFAGIYVKKTAKKPEEFVVKRQLNCRTIWSKFHNNNCIYIM